MQAASEINGRSRPAEVGRMIGETEQTMSNWKARGVPKSKHVALAGVIGCSAEWLATGRGPMRPSNLPAVLPPALTPQEEAWLGYFRGMSAQEKEEALRESQAAQRRREEAAAGLSVEKLEELLRQKRSA